MIWVSRGLGNGKIFIFWYHFWESTIHVEPMSCSCLIASVTKCYFCCYLCNRFGISSVSASDRNDVHPYWCLNCLEQRGRSRRHWPSRPSQTLKCPRCSKCSLLQISRQREGVVKWCWEEHALKAAK